MARPALRRPQNVPGPLYVDASCIDCGTCMWMAPETFGEADGQSAVHAQPGDPAARDRALAALVACPTASIGTDPPDPAVADVAASFPRPVAGDVHHCGYHAESSFGAASWFLRRPEGNVLVDSPRFAAPLVRRLEEMGGVDLMLLTHRDDVADHARFAERFGCRRVLHADDVGARTRDVEVQVQGRHPVEVAPGITAVPVPGHTRGHMVFHAGETLFTGDHLAWDLDARRLVAFRRACWYDWGEQTESMRRLLEAWDERPFSWVLPGHGDPVHLAPEAMRADLRRLVSWMEGV